MSAFAGSFPSGHVVSVLVCLGGALIVLEPHSRWRHWAWALVLAAGAGMAHGMLIQSAHWLTDVAGGALLGISVLAAASAWGPGRRSAPRPEQQPVAQRGASGSPDGGFRAAGAPRQP
jgi:undecaprenyl-diphosphatase